MGNDREKYVNVLGMVGCDNIRLKGKACIQSFNRINKNGSENPKRSIHIYAIKMPGLDLVLYKGTTLGRSTKLKEAK